MRSTLKAALSAAACILLCGCGSGGSGNNSRLAFTDYAGLWTGTWRNNTFGSSGPSTLNVALSSGNSVMDWTIHVEGNVFGGAAPPDETFHGAVTTTTVSLSGTSVAYGDLTLH